MILYEIGTSVCHQNFDRSFIINGLSLPICSRCTGIYLGAFLTYIYFLILSRRKGAALPDKSIMYILLSFIVLMGLDVGTVVLKLRDTNNYIRLATGFLTGTALVCFLYPISNFMIWEKEDKRGVISKYIDLLGLIFFLFIFYVLIISGLEWLYWLLAGLSIIGILILYFNTNLILVIMFFKKEHKIKSFKNLLYYIPIAIILAGIELYLLRLYHIWIRN
ncbi:MAG: DUF2085 domain-containing protein [Candidatus Firestonebacteria bacterium]|nr:DUF2085 domain-containing protein [Candidatus Firestonebacteria bacterium]